jgi:hypothetical protein
MEFDFSKLLGRIVEMFGTRTAFAEKWGKTDRYLSDRLNNKIVMDMVDILEMRELLDIACEDIPVYFFTVKVR